MCLDETYSTVQVCKHLSDIFPSKTGLKQGDALSPIAFQLYFTVCHYNGSGKLWGLKLNGTHQLLLYADDINILGGSIQSIKKNAEALFVTS